MWPAAQWRASCPWKRRGNNPMLHWSLIFLVIAIIAAILGFGGIAGTAAGIAKILFFVFLVIWIVGFFIGRRAV
jgi:uncharacterized membrane protein YtjA (UPF0391 family)